MMRKFIIISILVFISKVSERMQAVLAIVVLQTAYMLHDKHWPYDNERINKLEQKSLFSSGVVLFGGLYFLITDVQGQYDKYVVLLVCFFANGFFFFYWSLEWLRANIKKLEGHRSKSKIIRKLLELAEAMDEGDKNKGRSNKVFPAKGEDSPNHDDPAETESLRKELAKTTARPSRNQSEHIKIVSFDNTDVENLRDTPGMKSRKFNVVDSHDQDINEHPDEDDRSKNGREQRISSIIPLIVLSEFQWRSKHTLNVISTFLFSISLSKMQKLSFEFFFGLVCLLFVGSMEYILSLHK
eukprot:TRINITY_DN1758_c0_g1_i13.p1 TRINITY_DN1758_c0_g1~~TRINITY_DN1758_c0_g1_i13.p1  ORF type:complete len:298 (+),score=67.77 TRINITY_DN1758_c0_g1_i13:420-1313(+)